MWACDYSWKYDDSVIVDVMFFCIFPSLSQDYNVNSNSKSNKDIWFNILEEWHVLHIYLWSKVVCFVLLHWDLPNHVASCCTLGRKLLMSKGAPLVQLVWDYFELWCGNYWLLNHFFNEKKMKLKQKIALEFAGVLGVVWKLSAN
jgi:hypothetical protein